MSPAAFAWYARRLTSGSPEGGDASTSRARRWSATRSLAERESSTASRASSCLKETWSGCERSMPAARHSSSGATESATSASSSHGSACGGTTATASSTRRASGPSRAARASTASRTVSGISAPAAASASVTKNGFPDVLRYRSPASTPCGAASVADRVERQRSELDSGRPLAEGRFAEQNPERMPAVELVVSEGRDDQHRQRLDPARDDPEHVERRLVGPVHVFDHDHGRRRPAQLDHQRLGELVRLRAAGGDALELASDRARHIEERPEWARGEQRVAASPEDTRTSLVVAAGSYECGLADPGLSSDEDEPSAAARDDGIERIGEQQQLTGTLEQVVRRLRHDRVRRRHLTRSVVGRVVVRDRRFYAAVRAGRRARASRRRYSGRQIARPLPSRRQR